MNKKLTILLFFFIMAPSVVGLSIWSFSQPTKNFQNTYVCYPERLFKPHTIEEVQEIVRLAKEEDRKVMAGNSKFYSQIDAACPEDGQWQVSLENMQEVIDIDTDNKTVTVQAGARFNVFLEEIRQHDLTVNMVTDLALFSLGGMLGSGTHGSTLNQPAMLADYLTELKIVDGNGDLRIVTGDELDAVSVNLGVLGVVVEMTIQLEDLFKVEVSIDASEDDNLEEIIYDLAYGDHHSVNLVWFPGLGKYTVTQLDRVPNSTPGNAYNAQADTPNILNIIVAGLYQFSQAFPGEGSLLSCGLADGRYDARAKSYFNDYDTKKRIEEGPIVGYTDRIQYFKCNDKNECLWDLSPIMLHEISVPMSQLVDVVADMRKVLDANPRTCFPLNGIYFRFAKASPSYLGMASGEDSAIIGIEHALNQRGEKTPKNYFVIQEIEQLLLQKYDARVHWGKNSIALFENAKDKYPKWDDFVSVKQDFDPDNIFTNPFWERLTGELSLDDYRFPGCTIDGTCYCIQDSDCETGKSCVSGEFYKQAKVCRQLVVKAKQLLLNSKIKTG